MVGGRHKQAWFQDKLTKAVMTLCRQGNMYVTRAKVEGTICVVCDDNDVIVAHITESFFGSMTPAQTEHGGDVMVLSQDAQLSNQKSKTPSQGSDVITSRDVTCGGRSLQFYHHQNVENNNKQGQQTVHKVCNVFPPDRTRTPSITVSGQNLLSQSLPTVTAVKPRPYPHRGDPTLHSNVPRLRCHMNEYSQQLSLVSTSKDGIPQQQLSPRLCRSLSDSAAKERLLLKADSSHCRPPRSQDNGHGYVSSSQTPGELTTVYSGYSHSRWAPLNTIRTLSTAAVTPRPQRHGLVTPITVPLHGATMTSSPGSVTSQTLFSPYLDMNGYYFGKDKNDEYMSAERGRSAVTTLLNHKCPYCEQTFVTSSKLWKHIRSENCSSRISGEDSTGFDPSTNEHGFRHVSQPTDSYPYVNLTDECVREVLPESDVNDKVNYSTDRKSTKSCQSHDSTFHSQDANFPTPFEQPYRKWTSEQDMTACDVRSQSEPEVIVKVEDSADNELIAGQQSDDHVHVGFPFDQDRSPLNDEGLLASNSNSTAVTVDHKDGTNSNIDTIAHDEHDSRPAHRLPLRTLIRTSSYLKSRNLLRPSLLKPHKRPLYHHPKKRLSLMSKGHQKLLSSRMRMHSAGP